MTRKYAVLLILLVAVLVSACGTAATPAPVFTEVPTNTAEPQTAATEVSGAAQPTEAQPTATPEPPTATPEPATPTAEPATPTVEPTADTGSTGGAAVPLGNDPVSMLVSLANAAHGEELFNTMYDTNVGPYACATCHNVDSEERKIGPGQLNIAERGGTRIEGQPAAQYIYDSIVHPNDYIVEGYTPNLMPSNYSDLLSDQDIYDIIAYLFTLR